MRWALFCPVTVALAVSASAQDSYIPVFNNGVKQPSYSGMLKPFEYVNRRSTGQTPSTKSPDKAASKPSAANSHPAFHYAPTAHDGAPPASAPFETQSSKPAFRPASASVKLSPDVVKLPAETASGYCLQAPASYIGTGSLSRPAVTAALPRCGTR